MSKRTEYQEASFSLAIVPIIILIALLTINVLLFEDTLGGANQIALLLAAAIAGIIANKLGYTWKFVRGKIVETIGSSMPSILILLIIGSLAGTWMISGVVPVMIYYGLDIINPHLFLFTAVIVSAVVSVSTGSSWSTIATIGVALIGIGKAIGINEAVSAGAIISGAYFGDKVSPLSDTTNLAPAMAGTDLFTHIYYMLYTTIPSLVITLIIFLFIGFSYDFTDTVVQVDQVKSVIDSTFNTSPVLFVIPLLLLTIIVLKVPPLPALTIGTLLGGIFAIIFQPHIIEEISGITDNYTKASYYAFMQSMFGDVTLKTTDHSVNELLSTSGMEGMLHTVWLIISAMVFGGIMESAGLLKRIIRPVIQWVHSSTGGLVTSTVLTCIFFNTTASDQYLAIVVPGRMFKSAYKDKGLKPELLSRTLEDSGTITSVLIPWNTCGATQSRVLGVATGAYLPYAFFNLISPLMAIIIAYLNIKIRRLDQQTVEE
ncbi:MAG: Na+/H+ antiporter NhaC [Bacteroidetes bacterium]|nr:MAG: Na+/H+ antiporter NhaC [Bacteroidota bacterium]